MTGPICPHKRGTDTWFTHASLHFLDSGTIHSKSGTADQQTDNGNDTKATGLGNQP